MGSWEHSAKWYGNLIETGQSYFHNHLILPKLKPLLAHSKSILDLGCGSGVLLGILSKDTKYVGLDLSPSLLNLAKKNLSKNQRVLQADICNFDLNESFDTAACILTIQNVKEPFEVFKSVAKHMKKGAHLFIVMMHPCFRIPRQSHWGIDENKKLQYRRIDSYKKALDIPIQVHPGKKSSKKVFHSHRPLETYMTSLKEAGFVLFNLEEWTSPKKSIGSRAKMENRARDEFPLFLFLDALFI